MWEEQDKLEGKPIDVKLVVFDGIGFIPKSVELLILVAEVATYLNEKQEYRSIEDLEVIEPNLHHHPLLEDCHELWEVLIIHLARRYVELFI